MKLTDKLNTLLADSLVFYVKLHNYHWNVTGPHFELIHSKTESLYEYMAKFYDEVAERILQLGDKPIITIQSILEKTTIQEEAHDNFNDREVLHGIIHDVQHLHDEIKTASDLKNCDSVTSGFLDEQLTFLEKELWMLKATLG